MRSIFSPRVLSLSGRQAPKASLMFSASGSVRLHTYFMSLVMTLPPKGMDE